jgi:hypothetical protein
MMEKSKAAVAGSAKSLSPTVTPSSAGTQTPVTTRKDIEQNTYTSERSEQLREANVQAR